MIAVNGTSSETSHSCCLSLFLKTFNIFKRLCKGSEMWYVDSVTTVHQS